MLKTLLNLLPVVGPVVANLPEFLELIEQAKAVLSDDDADTLEKAYALARQNSDDAHADLQKLVARYS